MDAAEHQCRRSTGIYKALMSEVFQEWYFKFRSTVLVQRCGKTNATAWRQQTSSWHATIAYRNNTTAWCPVSAGGARADTRHKTLIADGHRQKPGKHIL